MCPKRKLRAALVGAALSLVLSVVPVVPTHASSSEGVSRPTEAGTSEARMEARQGTITVTVSFTRGSAAVSARARRTLAKALARLPKGTSVVVVVTAAIPRGSKGGNTAPLAAKRASATVASLRMAPGFDKGHVTVVRVAPRRVPASLSDRVIVDFRWSTPGTTPSFQDEPPTVPRSVSAQPGEELAVVGWQAPEATHSRQPLQYTAYAIRGRTRPPRWLPSADTPRCDSGPKLGCTITGLSAGTDYTIAVVASNEFGDSPPSPWDRGPVTPWGPSSPGGGSPTLSLPGAPGTPSLIASDGELEVRWSAPNTGGGSISGYRVTIAAAALGSYSDASGTCAVATTSASSTTSCTASELDNGTTYYVRVAAVNAAGTGPYSATSPGGTPRGTPGRPAAPAVTAGDLQATLTWSAPSDGGSAITGFTVQRSLFSGPFTSQPGCTNLAVTLACTATGLENGAKVRFRLAAKNAAGYGAFSAPSDEVIPAGVPGTPGQPTVTAGILSMTVDWPTASTNGSALTGYRVYQTTGSSSGTYSDVTSFCNESGTYPEATTCSLTGLAAGTTYFYKVSALNSRGEGSRSVASAGASPVADSTAPEILEVYPGNGSLDIAYSLSAPISGTVWSRYSSDDGATWSSWTDSSSTASPLTVSGLVNGTSYDVQIGLGSSSGSLRTSGTASGTPFDPAPPGAPAAPSGIAGDGYISLSWSAPVSSGGSDITGYQIQISTSASGPWTAPAGTCEPSQTNNATRAACVATGLTNGTAYFFQVAAINYGGRGSFSAASASVTPVGVPEQPEQPTADAGVNQVILAWTAPATQGSPITGYRVLRATDPTAAFSALSGGGCSAMVVSASTAVTCTDTDGLVAGADYYYRVAAISAAGDSLYSPQTGPVTPIADATAPEITSAVPGNRSASLSFTYSGAATNVEYSTNGGATWAARSPASGISPLSLSGLSNGTTYEVQIRMVTGSGPSAASASATVTPRTVPGAPAAPTGSSGNGQVTLRWNAPSDDGGSIVTGYTVRASSDGVTYVDQTGCTGLGVVLTCRATGLLGGTSYTFKVAAINAAGTGAFSAASSPITPVAATCAAGGTCSLGDTGPGGGIVFYVGSFTLTSTGQTLTYLEAAPANWNGGADPRVAWSGNSSTNVGTSTQLGAGAANTNAIVQQNSSAGKAATIAQAFRGGGLSDWFLPSTDEASKLYASRGLPGIQGSLIAGGYWNSTESSATQARVTFMSTGSNTYNKKSLLFAVRPIRAFAAGS